MFPTCLKYEETPIREKHLERSLDFNSCVVKKSPFEPVNLHIFYKFCSPHVFTNDGIEF